MDGLLPFLALLAAVLAGGIGYAIGYAKGKRVDRHRSNGAQRHESR